MSNVLFNGLSAVHAGSGGILTTVDVCNTPPFCQSVTYTNIAKSQDSAKTATSVKINSNPACVLTSNFAVSSGDDEAGTCGGTISGTIKGMAEFISASPNMGAPKQNLIFTNRNLTIPISIK